jgi:tRNA1Val (adenine37-N6)-methyltransferase
MSFQFKQFTVEDNRCAMKVGTDGVLLGAWANVEKANHVLDIGSGSGLIALMIAQRTDAHTTIDAVEMLQEDATQATENINASPWPDKISIHNIRIQDYKPEKKYDLIVSNPPFFNDSLPPPSAKRKTARHTNSLSNGELLAAVTRLIATEGIFAVILPVKEGSAFITMAQFSGLYCSRQVAVYSRKGKPQERWLLEFTQTPVVTVSGELILYEKGIERSAGYRKLVLDFYLHSP